MLDTRAEIAIVGAGIGGLAAAIALRRLGFDPHVYEQASQFGRVGAGINVSPNAVRVLRGLGVEDSLRSIAHHPPAWKNREWDTGALIYEIPLGAEAEVRYGAPFLQMHRADLHSALARSVPIEKVHFGRRLVGLSETDAKVRLEFSNGSTAEADIVIGADGIHSSVRQEVVGRDEPHFTGRVAFRGVIDADRMAGVNMGPMTKWWGPDRHIVIYYTSQRGDVYYVTSVPETDWRLESWSAEGSVDELRSWFADFHPEVREVLARCDRTHKWALYDREPLESWSQGNTVLLGDASHPMTPYLAQGAAMALEDAVVLARSLAASSGVKNAFDTFQATRWSRTSEVQRQSGANEFGLKSVDPTWLYAYDAWSIDLLDEAPVTGQHETLPEDERNSP